MIIYIVQYESIKDGYKVEGYANRKKAISKISHLNKEHRKSINELKKAPNLIERDFPISKKGLLTAINYI